LVGHDREGRRRIVEAFCDVTTGETYAPHKEDGTITGWNGSPPGRPEGVVLSNSEAYCKGYDLISWRK
jgi:hypothetical protein